MEDASYLNIHVYNVVVVQEGQPLHNLLDHRHDRRLPQALLALDVAKEFAACGTATTSALYVTHQLDCIHTVVVHAVHAHIATYLYTYIHIYIHLYS